MIIYNYDSISGILTGSSEADENPLEPGKYLFPAFSTTIAPPEEKDGFHLIFIENVWKYSAIVGESISDKPEITAEMVSVERDRRLVTGKEFSLDTVKVWLSGNPTAMTFMIVLKSKADQLKSQDKEEPALNYRDATNKSFMFTPDQFIELYEKGVKWVEEIYQVSWNMKDRLGDFEEGIPEDYYSDLYWPT